MLALWDLQFEEKLSWPLCFFNFFKKNAMLLTFAFMLSKKNTYAAILDTGVFCFLNTAEKHNVTLYVTNKITGVCSPLEQFELISTSETFIAEILFAGGLVFQLFSRLTPLLFL